MDFPLDFFRFSNIQLQAGWSWWKSTRKVPWREIGVLTLIIPRNKSGFGMIRQIEIPETNKRENSLVFFHVFPLMNPMMNFRIKKNHQLPLLKSWPFFWLASENHLQMEMANLSVWITLRRGRAWFSDDFSWEMFFFKWGILIFACAQIAEKKTRSRRIPVLHLFKRRC